MYELLVIVFLIIAVAIIGLVLIQKGKGADMGASFGSGASATLFGSAGTGNFLTRTTTILGILFFIVSLALVNLGSKKNDAASSLNLEVGAPTVVQQPTDANPASTNEGAAPNQEQSKPKSDIPE